MNNVIQYIFKPSMMDKEATKAATKSTAVTTHIMLLVVILAGVVLLGATFFYKTLFMNTLIYHRTLYIVLLLVSFIWLALARTAIRDYDERYKNLFLGNVILAATLYGWTIALFYIDIRFNAVADTTVFMTVSLLVPLCLYLHPLAYFLIAVGSDILMILLVFSVRQTQMSTETNFKFLNFLIFSVFQLMAGFFILYTKYSLQREILEKTRQHNKVEMLSRSQNRFFSNMSHEIRTPINTIIGLNEMTLRENVSPEINENSENIRSAGKMLLHLINDILDMSKIESGRLTINPVPYRTGDMLSDITGMFWYQAKDKGLDFSIQIAPDFPSELYGDDVRIRQIIINVLNNAIKYTKEGSVKLSLQCEKTDGDMAHVIYSVTDTGIGIRKENLPYLFTAFKREDEERNRYIEGTGLGLSIVKQFVELMGGSVNVNSVYTKGSTFIIEIPQKIVNAKALEGYTQRERRGSSNAGGYRQSFEAPKAQVLVVDDTRANIMVVEKLLRGTKMQIDSAASGKEALEKTQNKSYHVILMDHLMPGMDGIECMHKVKGQTGGMSRESRIVALTANAGSENAALYAREGFDGYLVKPVSGDELENEVRRLLPKELVNVMGSSMEITQESLMWMAQREKKAKVAITTESVADIPRQMLEQLHIKVIPHMVKTPDGIFRDDLELDQQGVLQYMEKNDGDIRAMAPSEAELESFFAGQLTHANNVVHISLSSRLEDSGCIAAMEAAKSFDNIFIVDSGNLSSGQGLMAIEAARLAQGGKSAHEIADEMEAVKNRVHTSFIVDSMEYLARTQQISERTAKLCRSFMLRPVLTMKKGKMTVGRVFFGARERAWNSYISAALDGSRKIDKRLLFVTYVGLTQNDLEHIRTQIEKKVTFEKIVFQKASPAIAVNCGPGTFGLLFLYA